MHEYHGFKMDRNETGAAGKKVAVHFDGKIIGYRASFTAAMAAIDSKPYRLLLAKKEERLAEESRRFMARWNKAVANQNVTARIPRGASREERRAAIKAQ